MEEGAKTVNDVTIFNFDGSDFRVIIRDGEPWFVPKDVCDVLWQVGKNPSPKRREDRANAADD